jgi:hypothetical protein
MYQKLWDDTCAVKKLAAEAFAAERGWRVSDSAFTFDQLRTGRPQRTRRDWRDGQGFAGGHHPDHVQYFRAGKIPAALVSHAYCTFEECAAFAEARGLNAELLQVSWHDPGGCIAVLFTPRRGPA